MNQSTFGETRILRGGEGFRRQIRAGTVRAFVCENRLFILQTSPSKTRTTFVNELRKSRLFDLR